jgi:hypothetical protein
MSQNKGGNPSQGRVTQGESADTLTSNEDNALADLERYCSESASALKSICILSDALARLRAEAKKRKEENTRLQGRYLAVSQRLAGLAAHGSTIGLSGELADIR